MEAFDDDKEPSQAGEGETGRGRIKLPSVGGGSENLRDPPARVGRSRRPVRGDSRSRRSRLLPASSRRWRPVTSSSEAAPSWSSRSLLTSRSISLATLSSDAPLHRDDQRGRTGDRRGGRRWPVVAAEAQILNPRAASCGGLRRCMRGSASMLLGGKANLKQYEARVFALSKRYWG